MQSPRKMTVLAILLVSPLAQAADSRKAAATRQAPEEALYEITVMGRSDPFREFLKATARYAALFNQLNDDPRFEMMCGDPREYNLGDGLFCSSQYTTTLTGTDAETRAELSRMKTEAAALGRRLREANPELQRLQQEWDVSIDRLNAYLQTPAGGRLFPTR
jgi:hypothetical protein